MINVLKDRLVVSKFWHQGPVLWKTILPPMGRWGDGFRVIQAHCIYCALYFQSNAAADLMGGTLLSPEVGDSWDRQ